MEIRLNQAAVEAFQAEHGPALLGPTAEVVRARQAQRCPRDTHANRHMADNIQVSHAPGHVDVGPAKRFFYARMVETGGNTNRKPRPFIRPSVDL